MAYNEAGSTASGWTNFSTKKESKYMGCAWYRRCYMRSREAHVTGRPVFSCMDYH